jgi:hypothetical protein
MKGWKAGLMAILVGLGMAVLVGCGGSKAPVKSTQQSISPLSMFEKSSFMRGKKRSISPLPRPTT